jgi:hypothetical protein
VSGFIAATVIAVVFRILHWVSGGGLWEWIGAMTAPVVRTALALPVHPNGLDNLVQLPPIYLATALFVVGAVLALLWIVSEEQPATTPVPARA